MAVKLADTLAPMGDFEVAEAKHVSVKIGENTKMLQKAIEDGDIGGGGGEVKISKAGGNIIEEKEDGLFAIDSVETVVSTEEPVADEKGNKPILWYNPSSSIAPPADALYYGIDKYSEEEIVVGEWTGGKPLYRKVVNQVISLTKQTWVSTSIDIKDVEQFIKVICIGGSASSHGYIGVSIQNNKICLYNSGPTDFEISTTILEYTKTTDAPNSFTPDMVMSEAVSNDYSTEEKKIGKWIDGKPIYRKVVPITSISTIPTNYTNITELNDIPIKNLIDISFLVDGENTGEVGVAKGLYGYVKNSQVFVKGFGGFTTIKTCIIEYTKTTD